MTVTKEQVRSVVARLSGRDVEDLADDVRLADLVADSFALVEMVLALQDELGAKLDGEALRSVSTLRDLEAIIVRG
jgi:acyl carrier protein